MAYYEAPPPEPEELLDDVAKFIAAAYRLKITVTVEHSNGNTHTTITDRLPRARAKEEA